MITTKKYRKLFQIDERNNLSQENERIVVNSTNFPDQVFIHSVFEPILKYSSQIGYITKIKNHLNKEITLDELVNQYFGNPEDYFEVRKEEEPPPSTTKEEKPKICKCYYCHAEFDTKEEYLNHSINTHPGKEAQPTKESIEHMK